MKTIKALWLALGVLSFVATAAEANTSFEQWVRQLKPQATAQGVSPATFDAAFAGVQPLPRVIELFERQPEVKLSFEEYLARVVPQSRIDRGRQLMAENRALLQQIGASYGESNLDLGPADLPTSGLVSKNESVVVGVYHPLTSFLNLGAEYTLTKATAHNGAEAEETAIAVGAILFY